MSHKLTFPEPHYDEQQNLVFERHLSLITPQSDFCRFDFMLNKIILKSVKTLNYTHD